MDRILIQMIVNIPADIDPRTIGDYAGMGVEDRLGDRIEITDLTITDLTERA